MRKLNVIYATLFCGLLLHVGILLGVLYLDPYTILAGTDSLSFYEDAIYVAQSGDYFPLDLGWKPYVNTVGFLMYHLGESISFMFLASTGAWLLSAILIDSSLRILKTRNEIRIITAAIIAVDPSLLFITSIPLRESFQLLGMTIIGFSAVKIFVEKRNVYFVLAIAGSALAGILHLSLLVSVSLFTIIVFLGYRYSERKLSMYQIAFSAILASLVLFAVIGVIASQYENGGDDILQTVDVFRETGAAVDARAQYDNRVGASSSVIGSIIGLFVGFIQYMIEPMPWRISTLGDMVVFVENALRLVLVFIVVRRLKYLSHSEFALSVTLLCMFATTEFVWSTGTINWGTAARHHVPSLPLLMITAFAIGRPRSYAKLRAAPRMRMS